MIYRLAGLNDELLQLVMQQAPTGMAVIDHEGLVVRANDSFWAIAGAEGGSSPGLTICDWRDRGGQASAWQAFGPVLSGSQPLQTLTTTMANPFDGIERTVEITAVALREADGLVSGLVLHVIDISEHVRLEAQLAHSQRLQVVGQFTGSIAHDFNNVLMAMTGAAEALLLRGGLDLEAQADLQEIKDSGERGSDLVRQLLAFSTSRPLQHKTIAVNDLVSGLSRLLSRLLGPNIDLVIALHDRRLAVLGDPTPLDQVLVNLIVNARNAMPDGGLVTLRTGELTLQKGIVFDQRSIAAGHYVIIDVQDSGTGIPADVLPKIFDPFFTTRLDQGGSGLGLATVDAIIRRFGGVLTVRSTVGAGTLFRIHLPKHDDGFPTTPIVPPADDAVRRMLGAPCPKGSRAMLLVDDEEGLRSVLARALVGAGWHVLCAESGEAALALLRDDPPSLANLCVVVTDVDLPDVEGPALVQAVRQLRPGVPAVLSSGHLATRVREALDDNTIFLAKPSSLKALLALVEKHAWPGRAVTVE